ncbi:LCP family glycopolymer transferase [Actinokineospora sp. NPDC004072]
MPDDYDADGAPSGPGGRRRAPDDQPRRRRRSLDDDGGVSVSDLVERHSASRADLPAPGRRRADESRHAAPEAPRPKRGGVEDLGAAMQGRRAAAEQSETPPGKHGRRRAPEQPPGRPRRARAEDPAYPDPAYSEAPPGHRDAVDPSYPDAPAGYRDAESGYPATAAPAGYGEGVPGHRGATAPAGYDDGAPGHRGTAAPAGYDDGAPGHRGAAAPAGYDDEVPGRRGAAPEGYEGGAPGRRGAAGSTGRRGADSGFREAPAGFRDGGADSGFRGAPAGAGADPDFRDAPAGFGDAGVESGYREAAPPAGRQQRDGGVEQPRARRAPKQAAEPGGPQRASIPADVVRQATGAHRIPADAGLDFDQFVPAEPPRRPGRALPEPTHPGDLPEDDRPSRHYPRPEPFPRDHHSAPAADDQHFPVDRPERPRPAPRPTGRPPLPAADAPFDTPRRQPTGQHPTPHLDTPGPHPATPDAPPRPPFAADEPHAPRRQPTGQFPAEDAPAGRRQPVDQYPAAEPPAGRRQPSGPFAADDAPAGRRQPTGQFPADDVPAGHRQPTGQFPDDDAPAGHRQPIDQYADEAPAGRRQPASQHGGDDAPRGRRQPTGQFPVDDVPAGRRQPSGPYGPDDADRSHGSYGADDAPAGRRQASGQYPVAGDEPSGRRQPGYSIDEPEDPAFPDAPRPARRQPKARPPQGDPAFAEVPPGRRQPTGPHPVAPGRQPTGQYPVDPAPGAESGRFPAEPGRGPSMPGAESGRFPVDADAPRRRPPTPHPVAPADRFPLDTPQRPGGPDGPRPGPGRPQPERHDAARPQPTGALPHPDGRPRPGVPPQPSGTFPTPDAPRPGRPQPSGAYADGLDDPHPARPTGAFPDGPGRPQPTGALPVPDAPRPGRLSGAFVDGPDGPRPMPGQPQPPRAFADGPDGPRPVSDQPHPPGAFADGPDGPRPMPGPPQSPGAFADGLDGPLPMPGQPHPSGAVADGPRPVPGQPQPTGAFADGPDGPRPKPGQQPTGALPLPDGPDTPQRAGRPQATGAFPDGRRPQPTGALPFPDGPDAPRHPGADEPGRQAGADEAADGDIANRLDGGGKPRIPRQQPVSPGNPEETQKVALTPPPGVSPADAVGLTTEMEPIGEATQKRRRVDQTLARFSKVHDELKAEERAKRAKRRLPWNAEDDELEEQLEELAKQPGEASADAEEKPKPKKRGLLARVFAGTTAIAVFTATGVGWGFLKHTGDNIDKVRALDPDSAAIQDAEGQRGDENFLLIGSDSREGAEAEEGVGDANQVPGARADTTMIAHVPADRSRVVIVSFPRDLEIERPDCERFDPKTNEYTGENVPGVRITKLNTAYQVGGPLCATKVVQELSGLRITRFIGIDFHGFKEMVDAVDGVTVCVEKPMYDSYMKKWIVRQAGKAVELRGDQALDFVRARHLTTDGTSDYGRIKRQQRFLSSLLRKSMSGQVLLDPGKLTAFTQAFTNATFGDNITVESLISLGQSLQGLEAGRVTFLTVPTVGISNERGNEELRVEDNAALFRAIVNNQPLPGEAPAQEADDEQRALPQSSPLRARQQQVDPKTLKIQVLNGGNTRGGIARDTGAKLAEHGYQVVMVSAAPKVPHTVIYYGTGNEAAARTLASSIPGVHLKADPSVGKSLVLVVGPEYDGEVVAPGTAKVTEPEPEKLPGDLSAINAGDVTCA